MIKTYRFGTIDVICEGYDYPDDPYVLKGSCGVCVYIVKSIYRTNTRTQIVNAVYIMF